MNAEPLYRIRSLSFSYGSGTVLEIPFLDIPKGRIVSLLGPNGSGKTTLLKLLAGLLPSARGTIGRNGERTDRERTDGDAVPSAQDASRAVYVHQNPLLLTGTVFDNVAYGLKLRRIPREEVAARVGRSLGAVGLADFARRRARRLSGGNRSASRSPGRWCSSPPRCSWTSRPRASIAKASS